MRFIRMMSWEFQGIGTKEWAGKTAPFFACRKVLVQLPICCLGSPGRDQSNFSDAHEKCRTRSGSGIFVDG